MKQTLGGLTVETTETGNGLNISVGINGGGPVEIKPQWTDLEDSLPLGDQHNELRSDLRKLSAVYREHWPKIFGTADSVLGWMIWKEDRYAAEDLMLVALSGASVSVGAALTQVQGALVAEFETGLMVARYAVQSGKGKVLTTSARPASTILEAMRDLRLLDHIEG